MVACARRGQRDTKDDRDGMKHGRIGLAVLGAAFALGLAVPAAAQDASPPPPTETPATDAVGPRELRDFSLPGTVTRPAEPPAQRPAPATTRPSPATSRPAPTTTQPAPARSVPAQPAPTARPAAPSSRPATTEPPARPTPAPIARETAPAATPAPPPVAAPSAPASSVTRTLSPAAPPAGDFAADEPAPSLPTSALPDSGEGGLGPLPWLLALALLAGAGVYFWRQRTPGLALAGGYREAPAPAPSPTPAPRPLQRAPQPQPQPQRTPQPQPPSRPPAAPAPPATPALPTGIVSTRIRPWLEIEFTPTRCVLAEDKATIEFDIALFNSGSAPARDVLVEGTMFNAGASQDEEIGRFFATPVGQGDRIPVIEPLRKLSLKSAVSLGRDQLREFEVAGRRLFVPLLGFNALYSWSSGQGQTSASYLVGRDTDNAKLAPFRLDLGPRLFRGLAAREHQVRVRQ